MFNCILITGGAGFAGSSLAISLKLCYPRARVLAFDNLRRRGSEINLDRLREAGVGFVHGDVRSPADLDALPEAPELLIECSAEPSALAGYGGSPEYLVRTNVDGCFHCLELARRVRARILFLSTSRVYPVRLLNNLGFKETETRYELLAEQAVPGAGACGVSEEFPLEGARSLYGMTKLAAELMVEEYAHAYGVPYIINRCGLLTGPGQMARSDQGVMALWVGAHYFRRPLTYIGFNGSGKQVRDVLHIADLCDLVTDQLENWERYGGRRYNVGGGPGFSLSLREATRLCQQITGNTIPITPEPENRPADLRIYLSDTRRVSAVNGWMPQRDVSMALKSVYDWVSKEETRLRPLF